jgi:hypothetical protein
MRGQLAAVATAALGLLFPQRLGALVAYAAWIYNNRNLVERLWRGSRNGGLLPHEKTARSFLGILCLASPDWIKS